MEKILVIVPAYNEADTIVEIIHSLKSNYPVFDVLVVNDGSTDDTGMLAEQSQDAEVIHLPINLGIGGCVQTGLIYAAQYNYDIALQFDADGQHLISEIEKLIDPVKKNEFNCVIGSRFVSKSDSFKPSSVRMLGVWLIRFFSFLYCRQWIADQTSGFRAFDKKCIAFLAEHYPEAYPEPSVIVLLARNKFKIKEVFTQMRERQGGVSSIPLWKGPYYILRVLFSMSMAVLRSHKYNH